MRNLISQTLLTACVNSHLADPQGKWTTNMATSNLITAYSDASGVPYWIAQIVVMEKCADKWLESLADVCRSYLRPNTASHPFVIAETVKRAGREDRAQYTAHTVSGAFSRLVDEWGNPYRSDTDAVIGMNPREKVTAFFRFLHESRVKNPDLLSGYSAEVTEWLNQQIADLLTPADLRAIEAQIKHAAEERKREAEEARQKFAAEQAEREKRAAAAAARKARKAAGA